MKTPNTTEVVSESVEGWKQKFREEFAGQTPLSQAILGALEYRGFNDAGKYLDDDISERIIPIIEGFLSSTLTTLIKEMEGALITFPPLDEYIKVIKEGDKDDIYQLGFEKGISVAIEVVKKTGV